MESFVVRTALPVPAPDAFAWHEREGALERLSPPWEDVRVIEKHGTIRDGDRIVLSVAGTLGKQIEHVHRDYVPGRSFRDEQVRGLFAHFSHTHEVIPDREHSIMEDRIEYALPLGALGRALGGGMVRERLARMFAYRHETLRRDLFRHAGRAPMKVAVTGASGVIGSALCAFLSTGGHDVIRMQRGVHWDPDAGTIDLAALEGVDAFVHLAGENVGARWTPERKKRIVRSRVDGTKLVADACLAVRPRVLVSASAIGIYGSHRDGVVDETSALGDDFLADVCKQWEAAAEPARAATRVVNMRIGVVLTPTGGALAEVLPLFRTGLGGPLGDGRQMLSWISLDDVVGAIHRALYEMSGPVNAVAPHAVSNREYAKTLGRVLHRPAFVPAPAFAVRTVFGEMGKVVALGGQHVAPARLAREGFHFFDETLEPWLRRTLGQNRSRNGE